LCTPHNYAAAEIVTKISKETVHPWLEKLDGLRRGKWKVY